MAHSSVQKTIEISNQTMELNDNSTANEKIPREYQVSLTTYFEKLRSSLYIHIKIKYICSVIIPHAIVYFF